MEFLAPLAPYYYFVYWLIVLILTISQFNVMQNKPGYAVISWKYSYKTIFLFSVFFILIYGFRPVTFDFGDSVNYAKSYALLKDFGVFNMQGSSELGSDWIFSGLMFICAQLMDVHIFFAICLSLYIVMMYKGCKELDYAHGAVLILFCYGTFEFYPFAVNGVRNGVACSFVIIAVAYLSKKKMLMAIVLSFIAIGFHKSTTLPVFCMFISYFVWKPKYMFITWILAVFISLTIGEYIDNLLTMLNFDQRLANNLRNSDADGVVMEHRFRWDFLLYSFMPILLAWYTIFKRRLYNRTYLVLLGTYIYANCFWVLAIRAIFSNRIAYLSWFLYPIVLAYPLLNFPVFKKQHSKKTAWILLASFGFTTLLWLIG